LRIPSAVHYVFHCTHPPTHALYTLSLHDALPIWLLDETVFDTMARTIETWRAAGRLPTRTLEQSIRRPARASTPRARVVEREDRDRKSTRLNSSHVKISYAVFCLKKKNRRTRQRA